MSVASRLDKNIAGVEEVPFEKAPQVTKTPEELVLRAKDQLQNVVGMVNKAASKLTEKDINDILGVLDETFLSIQAIIANAGYEEEREKALANQVTGLKTFFSDTIQKQVSSNDNPEQVSVIETIQRRISEGEQLLQEMKTCSIELVRTKKDTILNQKEKLSSLLDTNTIAVSNVEAWKQTMQEICKRADKVYFSRHFIFNVNAIKKHNVGGLEKVQQFIGFHPESEIEVDFRKYLHELISGISQVEGAALRINKSLSKPVDFALASNTQKALMQVKDQQSISTKKLVSLEEVVREKSPLTESEQQPFLKKIEEAEEQMDQLEIYPYAKVAETVIMNFLHHLEASLCNPGHRHGNTKASRSVMLKAQKEILPDWQNNRMHSRDEKIAYNTIDNKYKAVISGIISYVQELSSSHSDTLEEEKLENIMSFLKQVFSAFDFNIEDQQELARRQEVLKIAESLFCISEKGMIAEHKKVITATMQAIEEPDHDPMFPKSGTLVSSLQAMSGLLDKVFSDLKENSEEPSIAGSARRREVLPFFERMLKLYSEGKLHQNTMAAILNTYNRGLINRSKAKHIENVYGELLNHNVGNEILEVFGGLFEAVLEYGQDKNANESALKKVIDLVLTRMQKHLDPKVQDFIKVEESCRLATDNIRLINSERFTAGNKNVLITALENALSVVDLKVEEARNIAYTILGNIAMLTDADDQEKSNLIVNIGNQSRMLERDYLES